MNPVIARTVRWVLTTLIVVFLVIFARTIDWAAAWNAMRGASMPLLVAAIVANFLSLAIKGTRWWLFLKPAGAPSLGLATRATLAGCGVNNIVVANGGDAARVVFVTRATGLPSSTVLATLALERLFDPVGFMILLVVGIVAYPLPASLERWGIPAQVALAAVLAFLVWFVYTSRHSTDSATQQARAHGFLGKFKAYLKGFAASTRYLTSGPRFVGALLISMIAWALQVATFHFAAAAAHFDLPPAAVIAAVLATNLGLIIRATPGNVGFFQVVFAVAVAPFGIERSEAVAVSLLIQTVQIIPITLAGIALAPEFIFRGRSAVREEAKELARDSEPLLLGALSKEREKLAAAPGEP